MKPTPQLYRIIDANFNRAKEGLRVCEDIARYGWNKQALTKSLKDLRHELTTVTSTLNVFKMLQGRDVILDVGRPSCASELKRKDIPSVFFANAQRVKESLRVLEEVAKLFNPSAAQGIKTLRYQMYVLEQKAVKKR
ncbi:MAG: thiamine-phosphate pyrophosphorylase [Candidatus Omnitrophica bacterium]|nr:thiamine-phosphate pyrophosphorylase [Candidatus Omnitrophota bacterium]